MLWTSYGLQTRRCSRFHHLSICRTTGCMRNLESRRNSCLLYVFWEPVRRSRDRWWCRLLWALWDLFFIDPGTKVNGQYYRDVLLSQQLLPAIRDLSGELFTFQQDNAPAHRARETVQLLTRETPDFIAANSPDLNPVDYQIWGKLQERVYRSRIRDIDQLKSRLINKWEHFHQMFIDEAVRQWRPCLRACIRAHGGHFEHKLWVCLIFAVYRRTLWQSCAVAYNGHFMFLGDLTKTAVTVASIDRFYLNLAICLQFDVPLLMQNFVKIRHCLTELLKCI